MRHKLIEIRHDILIQFHVNCIEIKKTSITCLKLTFKEITHKKCPDALLAKTMIVYPDLNMNYVLNDFDNSR